MKLTGTMAAGLLWMVSMWALTACGDNDDDTPALQLLEQVVTFTGNSTGRVNFAYRAVGDSPEIELWGEGHIDEKQTPRGSRLLLRYRLAAGADPSKGGKISFVSLKKIITDTVTTAATTTPTLGGLYVYTLQRSGEYLDLMARMPATKQRSITIESSPTPGPDGIVDLWIDATAGPKELTDSAYETTTWASLWIGPVWNGAETEGVRVHVNNTNNPYRSTFLFEK